MITFIIIILVIIFILLQVSSAGEQNRNEDGAQGPLQPVQLQKVAASLMVTAMFLPVTVLLASGNMFPRICWPRQSQGI